MFKQKILLITMISIILFSFASSATLDINLTKQQINNLQSKGIRNLTIGNITCNPNICIQPLYVIRNNVKTELTKININRNWTTVRGSELKPNKYIIKQFERDTRTYLISIATPVRKEANLTTTVIFNGEKTLTLRETNISRNSTTNTTTEERSIISTVLGWFS